MKKVFAISDCVLSLLGYGTSQNFQSILKGDSGIQKHHRPDLFPEDFFASIIENEMIETLSDESLEGFDRFEKMLILAVEGALKNCDFDYQSQRTLFIFSSTKGNVEYLSNPELFKKSLLWKTAQTISDFFGNPNKPITVSNACISGIVALNTGADFIRSGLADQVVVFGGDLVSQFTLSGFMSFKAVAPEPCKPFDKNRLGVNLGEGAACIVLSKDKQSVHDIQILGSGLSNDANHISGPSRTGDGLILAIERAMLESNLSSRDIDFISAHGTATTYNDEMESLAFAGLGLSHVPLNSLKGYFGHTLGVAGIIESAITLESMRQNQLIASAGFFENGVSGEINVIKDTKAAELKHCLKTGSGFGGCNAAIIFSKS